MDTPLDPTTEESEGAPLNVLELPFYSVGGLTGPRTMKLAGLLQDRPIIVMIDSGASHNFLSARLARELALPADPSTEFSVCLGDGRRRPTLGQCKGVPFSMGSCLVTTDFYLFELGGLDAILGVAWLETLGDVRVNWASMTMAFQHHGQPCRLVGDPTLLRSPLSFRAMTRITDVDFSALLWPIQTEPARQDDTIVADLQAVLTDFEDIFATPSGLPPSRPTDHAIVLQPGTAAVSVRPYRYGHAQKDEMERLVREMLLGGLIRPSASPFSSPVLLVRKKDGSWRFCVDYRELNKATVADKYPIPVIQELLDELHGAAYFTKLDLRAGYHQIRVRPADVPKTAFRTHDGHFEFLVMPFGLTNAPATFQATMNDIFRPVLRKHVLVFFDDILVFSRSWQDHLRHVRATFTTLRQHQLAVHRKKCSFGASTVSYLGHTISARGVAYRLRLPETARIHPVFHVSQLRRVIGDHPVTDHIPADLEYTGPEPLYPEAVVDQRPPTAGHGPPEEIRVAWRGRPASSATWLLRDDFRRQFPDYCLEDKAHFPDGGIVTDILAGEPEWQVYSRRKHGGARTDGGEGTRTGAGGIN